MGPQWPLALGLLALGNEGLPLAWLWARPGITEASEHALGAGAVSWLGGEDVICAWGGGLLGAHHKARLIFLFLLQHCVFVLQLFIYQVHRLGGLG